MTECAQLFKSIESKELPGKLEVKTNFRMPIRQLRTEPTELNEEIFLHSRIHSILSELIEPFRVTVRV